MGATFTPELDNYVNKDGLQSIKIRITVGRKLKRVPVGFAISAKNWNPEKKEVRKTHPQYYQINAVIKAKVIELEQMYLKDQSLNRNVTAESLQKKVVRKYSSESFLDYAKKRISLLPSAATRENQFSIIKKLEAYLKGKDLLFSDITTDFLLEYKNYLIKELGNSNNTVRANIKKLQASYNDAIETGAYEYEKVSPFVRVKIKKEKPKRTKLTEEHIKLLEGLNLTPGIMKYHSRNAFLFSYYMQGMRVSDLLQIDWSQIKGDRLYYKASKTSKGRSRLIISKGMEILNYYRPKTPKGYVFPFLKGKKKSDYTDEEWVAVLDAANSNIRNYLMEIAQMIGIEKLSMHVARHTFADIARIKTGDIYLVSDALDHGDIKTTANYFAEAEDEDNDKFLKSVLGE
jgi:integrase